MLELKNISITLKKSNRKIIDNFSFTLNKCEKAVIIGEEGNGKSSLLKLICNENLIDDFCETSGSIIKKGKIGYLPQAIAKEVLSQTISDYFIEEEIYNRISLITSLGLTIDFLTSSQEISTLSGGEKVKIQLAKILMQEPDILLLDEPTNDIDITTLKWLEKFINSSQLTILYVSHDEVLIENTANVIIHIEQIVRKTKCIITVTHSNYSDYKKNRTDLFSKQMQVAKKQRSDFKAQQDKLTQIYNKVDHQQATISRSDPGGARLLKKKIKSVKSQEKRIIKQSESFADIPQVEDAIIIKFSDDIYIPKTKEILDFELDTLKIDNKTLSKNIFLSIYGNEHIGIVGKNGIGKSTLLMKIYEIIKDKTDIISYYMPQDYSIKLNYLISPIEYLAINYSKEDITKARTYMGSMKFTHEEMTGKIGDLSGGQKAKILFLDMVLKNANVLLLDEPTRNFSPLSSPVICKILSEFKGVIISISHDRNYLNSVCDKIYELTKEGLILKE